MHWVQLHFCRCLLESLADVVISNNKFVWTIESKKYLHLFIFFSLSHFFFSIKTLSSDVRLQLKLECLIMSPLCLGNGIDMVISAEIWTTLDNLLDKKKFKVKVEEGQRDISLKVID